MNSRSNGLKPAAEVEVLAAGPGPLSRPEHAELARHEETIRAGLKTFLEVGASFQAIRDGRLYRATHDTFEGYCDERWGMSRRNADRIVAAAEVAAHLRPIGLKSVSSEWQIWPLVGLEPGQMRAAWEDACRAAGGEPTGRQVQAAVDEVLGRAAGAALEEGGHIETGEDMDEDEDRAPSVARAIGAAAGATTGAVADAILVARRLSEEERRAMRTELRAQGKAPAEVEALVLEVAKVNDPADRVRLGGLLVIGYDLAVARAKVFDGVPLPDEDDEEEPEDDDVPAGAVVRGEEPAEPGSEDSLNDEEWLRKAGVRARLANPWLFDQEALRYRRLRPVVAQYKHGVQRQGIGQQKAQLQGPYTRMVLRVISARHPWSWLLCGTCGGKGQTAVGRCADCTGGGFQLG